MAEPRSTAAKKATPAKRIAAPARTRAGKTGGRTAAAPGAEVEDAAAAAAAAAPRKRAVAPRDRPAAKAAAAMRGEPDADTPTSDTPAEGGEGGNVAEAKNATLIFKDRSVEVMLPTQEQLTMYRRLSREFQALGRDGNADRLSLDEALRQLDRAVRLVQSVLASDDDKEWIEDQLLEGKLTLMECTELLQEAFRRLHKANTETGNRQQRRAASRARLADE